MNLMCQTGINPPANVTVVFSDYFFAFRYEHRLGPSSPSLFLSLLPSLPPLSVELEVCASSWWCSCCTCCCSVAAKLVIRRAPSVTTHTMGAGVEPNAANRVSVSSTQQLLRRSGVLVDHDTTTTSTTAAVTCTHRSIRGAKTSEVGIFSSSPQ